MMQIFPQPLETLLVKHEIKIHYTRGGQLKLVGLSALPRKDAAAVVNFAREHREQILSAINHGSLPCQVCQAAGTWRGFGFTGEELLCFYQSYYEGRPVRPVPCEQAGRDCPLEKDRRPASGIKSNIKEKEMLK